MMEQPAVCRWHRHEQHGLVGGRYPVERSSRWDVWRTTVDRVTLTFTSTSTAGSLRGESAVIKDFSSDGAASKTASTAKFTRQHVGKNKNQDQSESESVSVSGSASNSDRSALFSSVSWRSAHPLRGVTSACFPFFSEWVIRRVAAGVHGSSAPSPPPR